MCFYIGDKENIIYYYICESCFGSSHTHIRTQQLKFPFF